MAVSIISPCTAADRAIRGRDRSMSSSHVRLLFVFGLATLLLIYAAGVQDRELVHALVQRLDGPLVGVLLGLGVRRLARARGRSVA
jgi:hypothetical protein